MRQVLIAQVYLLAGSFIRKEEFDEFVEHSRGHHFSNRSSKSIEALIEH
jgi:hypothetical protein